MKLYLKFDQESVLFRRDKYRGRAINQMARAVVSPGLVERLIGNTSELLLISVRHALHESFSHGTSTPFIDDVIIRNDFVYILNNHVCIGIQFGFQF